MKQKVSSSDNFFFFSVVSVSVPVPVHVPVPIPDAPWIMPIAEHSAFPRPDPNPVPVAHGFSPVTNPNSSDSPVKPKNLPKAKPSILGTLRSLLSNPQTYGAATLLADVLFLI